MNRRKALGLLATAPTAAVLGAATAAQAAALPHMDDTPFPGDSPVTSTFLEFDPVTHFRQSLRIQRSLTDEDDILHWYHFIMVAVPAAGAPRLVVRWEGIELSRHRKLRDDVYRIHGHNLSFPRDLEDGRFVDTVINPLTKKRVTVPPLALTSDPGMLVSPDGNFPLDGRTKQFRPKYGVIRRESNTVKIDAIRVPPDSWPSTFIEMGYEATPAALFDDPSQLWLPTRVSGSYVFPWPEWMKMGDAPGHMFATWSGYKLRSVASLPLEFHQRATTEFPNLLSVDLTQFDRPVTIPGR